MLGSPVSSTRIRICLRSLHVLLCAEIPQLRSMPSPLCVRCRQNRDVDKGSVTTLNTALPEQREEFTPQQYGVMGMEALDTAIHYWEDAIAVFHGLPNSNGSIPVMALPVRKFNFFSFFGVRSVEIFITTSDSWETILLEISENYCWLSW